MSGATEAGNRHLRVMTRYLPAATLRAVNTRAELRSDNSAGVRLGADPRADAMRDVAGIAPGLLPFGMALGIVIAGSAMGDGPGIVGAPLVYGGSAQLTATTMFQQGAGWLAVLGSALLVNARLLLYSASLSPRFRGEPTWFRLMAANFITDQTYLAAQRRAGHAGRQFRVYWWWLGLGVMVVWTGAVCLGVLVGPRLPTLPHLTFAGTALFLGMLMPRIRDRPSLAAAVTAGTAAPVAAELAPAAGVVVGAAAGMVAGMTAARRRPS
jgi:predicted branched-subunit amino acid permease